MQKFFGVALGLLVAVGLCACRASPVFADEIEIDVSGDDLAVASEDDLAVATTDATFTYQHRYVVFLDDLDDYLENDLGSTSRGNFSYSASFLSVSAATLRTYINTYGTWPSFVPYSGYYGKVPYSFTGASTFIEEWGSGDGFKQLTYIGVCYSNGFMSGDQLDLYDVTAITFSFDNCGVIPVCTSGSSSTSYRYAHELYDLYDVQYVVVCIEYDFNGSTYQVYKKVDITDTVDYSVTLSFSSKGVDITGYAIFWMSYSSDIDDYSGTMSSNDSFYSAFGVNVDSYPYLTNYLVSSSSVSNMVDITMSDYDSDLSSYFDSLYSAIYSVGSSVNGNMATYYDLLVSRLDDISDSISSISSGSSDSVDYTDILESIQSDLVYDINGTEYTAGWLLYRIYVVLQAIQTDTLAEEFLPLVESLNDNVGSILSILQDGISIDFEYLFVPDDDTYDSSYSDFSGLVDDHFGFLSTSYDYCTDFYNSLSTATASDEFVFPGVSLELSDDVTFSIESQTVSVSEYIPSDMLMYVRVTLTALFIFAWLNGCLAIYHRIFKQPTF